jgi:hypothetical protein
MPSAMSPKKKLKIRMIALLGLLLVLMCIGYAYANQAARTVISIYKYDGVEDNVRRSKFGQYKGILRRRIHRIAEQLGDQSRGKEFEYIRKLDLVETEQTAGSLAKREQIWNNTKSLQLLSGVVFVDGDTVTVMTEVFIGLSPEYFDFPSIEIELSVSPEEYRKTSDIYSALTLYAILVDAIEKQPPHIASQYLSEVNNYIKDLDQQATLTIKLKKALKISEEILKAKSGQNQ